MKFLLMTVWTGKPHQVLSYSVYSESRECGMWLPNPFWQSEKEMRCTARLIPWGPIIVLRNKIKSIKFLCSIPSFPSEKSISSQQILDGKVKRSICSLIPLSPKHFRLIYEFHFLYNKRIIITQKQNPTIWISLVFGPKTHLITS